MGGIVGGIASAVIGGSAAKKAANTQASLGREEIALNRDIFDQTTENNAPFLESGQNALGAFLFELGLGPPPVIGGSLPNLSIEEIPGTTGLPGGVGGAGRADTQTAGVPGTPAQFRVGDNVFDTREAAQTFIDTRPVEGGNVFNGLQASPAALFALQQGRDTIEAGAAARGGLNSGATLADLEELRFGLAAGDRDNQLNRLAGLIDTGQNAAVLQAGAGNAFASQAGNALSGIGNARSAGIIGQNNAFQNGLSNLAGSAGFLNGTTGENIGNSIFDSVFGNPFSGFGS